MESSWKMKEKFTNDFSKFSKIQPSLIYFLLITRNLIITVFYNNSWIGLPWFLYFQNNYDNYYTNTKLLISSQPSVNHNEISSNLLSTSSNDITSL